MSFYSIVWFRWSFFGKRSANIVGQNSVLEILESEKYVSLDSWKEQAWIIIEAVQAMVDS